MAPSLAVTTKKLSCCYKLFFFVVYTTQLTFGFLFFFLQLLVGSIKGHSGDHCERFDLARDDLFQWSCLFSDLLISSDVLDT